MIETNRRTIGGVEGIVMVLDGQDQAAAELWHDGRGWRVRLVERHMDGSWAEHPVGRFRSEETARKRWERAYREIHREYRRAFA